jgi:glycosyltransferase involved in cell wall biosynthesis
MLQSDNVTIVVPYYNEVQTIEYTLEKVATQSSPAKEAIFVNSSSSDQTSNVIDRWIVENQCNYSTKFINLFEHTNNPACSKNVGINASATEWVAFMDCGQMFGSDWISSQIKFINQNNDLIVSGIVIGGGRNWVDRCAIAQTYGYKKGRPCLPTSLVNKKVFEKVGLFSKGRRAGYDAAWLNLIQKFGIRRGINYKVSIQYIGTNFASTLKGVFLKSFLYAKPTVGIRNYFMPYVYFMVFSLFAILSAIYGSLSIYILIFYVFIRSTLIPILKSRNILIYTEHPIVAFFGLGITGVAIDAGKFFGIAIGIVDNIKFRLKTK